MFPLTYVQRAHMVRTRKSACHTLYHVHNLLNNNNESRVRIALTIAAVCPTKETAMEQVHQQNLEELHRRLMMDVKSDTDGIAKGLETAIGDLGVYTQEVLTNMTGHMETALSAACRLSKPLTVSQLLHLQAIPTLEVYRSLMTSREKDNRRMIASLLLMFSKPSVRLRVLWLACIHNEVEIVKLCLLNPYIDSNVVMDLSFDSRLRESWNYPEAPLPIQYAASQGFDKLVEMLEAYLDEDKHTANDSYVDYLLLAACNRHRSLAEHILRRRKATAVQYARIYEIIGASEIIVNNSALGKVLWKKAISILESSGNYRSRLVNDILNLEPTMQDFRTPREIDGMRAKELRIQALSIMRKYFGHSYVFAHALTTREYSKKISVFALEYITSQDGMSAIILKKIENSLDQLKFFLFPDRDLVVQCLRWCIDFVGHLRALLEFRPICHDDLERLRTLCDFTCRILLTVEILDDSFDDQDEIVATELNHLLRRVVAVFQPLNEKCCLLDRLYDIRKNRPGTKNVFKILNKAGADLVVTDEVGNVVQDYAAKFCSKDIAQTDLIIDASNVHFTMMSEG